MIFGTNLQKTVYFRSKTQKNEHHYWIRHIRISLNTSFQLELTNAIFWTKFAEKGSYFQSKTDKIDTTIQFCILELVFVSNFTLNKQFFNFCTKFAQERYLPSKTEKVNIIIEFRFFKLALVPSFSLNWKFWFFWPDLPEKGFSGLKLKKWTPHNSTYQVSLVQNFSSNWQFLFLDQFYTKTYFRPKTEKINIIIEFRIFKLVSWN